MTKVHNLGGHEETRSQQEHRHGRSQTGPRRTFAEIYPDVDVRKVPADSVPYGEQVSPNGRYVWAVYLAGELLCLGRTAAEARNNFYGARARLDADRLLKAKGTATPAPLKS